MWAEPGTSVAAGLASTLIFPVISSREGYGNALTWTRQVLLTVMESAAPAVFADTASRVFFSG